MTGELVYAMPSMGADMEQGTVLEWMVGPGDAVHRGDVVARIDTEKAEVDAEIWLEGVVVELLAQPGECLPVGAPLARIGATGAAIPHEPVTAPLTPAPGPAPSPVTAQEIPAAAPHPGGGYHGAPTFSPLVRHDAERLGVDLHRVHGSGVGGAVTRRDLTAPEPEPEPEPLSVSAGPVATFVRASPYARALARDAAVALADITGSGPGGAVLARDIARAARRGGPHAGTVGITAGSGPARLPGAVRGRYGPPAERTDRPGSAGPPPS